MSCLKRIRLVLLGVSVFIFFSVLELLLYPVFSRFVSIILSYKNHQHYPKKKCFLEIDGKGNTFFLLAKKCKGNTKKV